MITIPVIERLDTEHRRDQRPKAAECCRKAELPDLIAHRQVERCVAIVVCLHVLFHRLFEEEADDPEENQSRPGKQKIA